MVMMLMMMIIGHNWVPNERGRKDEGGEEKMNNERDYSPLLPSAIELGKTRRREKRKKNPQNPLSPLSLPFLNASILVILPSFVANFRGRVSSPLFLTRWRQRDTNVTEQLLI